MKISDDEKKEFQDAMYGVKQYEKTETRIKQESHHKPLHTKEKPARPLHFEPVRIPRGPQQTTKAIKPVSGHDILSFAKNGLQHKKFSQLKQEKIKIQATLDLHEHTSDEALIATDHFIERCRQKGFRAVCIIHGKGLYSSDNNPVLKNLLNHYLREHEGVIAFHSSKNNTGSMIVMLKR